MAEDKITAAETANEGTKKSENIVELAKPYVFEGKEYGEIDLTGLEKLTVQDAIDVQRQLFGEGEAAASVLCETTTAFARAMAVKATGMPIEFFKLMPRGAFKRVAGAVRRHLNVESRTENHVMHLEQPRPLQGQGVPGHRPERRGRPEHAERERGGEPHGPRGLCGDGEQHQLSVLLRDRRMRRVSRRSSLPRCLCMSC